MDYKDPIQVAREILERDVLAEDVAEIEEATEIEEVEEGKIPPQFLKKKKKKDDDEDDDEDLDEAKSKTEDDDDEDEDEEELEEAETILDVDDNQDAEGKKATPVPKGKKKQPEPKMKPSKTGDATKETMKGVKEHIAVLFDGEELTEDFQSKATTIFEAAINERVVAIEEDLRGQYETLLDEQVTTLSNEMTSKLDDYLNYVVEEWMKENELAVESGIRTEVAESFMDGLKGLFESHYISVPDEKYDLLEASLTKVTEMETQINEQIERNIELKKELLENTCGGIFTEVSAGLVDTEVEKLRSLAEGIEYDNADQYKEKLNVLKESYFDKSNPDASNYDEAQTLSEETTEKTETSSGPMSQYMNAISKHSNYNKM
tara:strand:+ start:1141 stop:2268 length:1128 start_codon:yes stop_codon:yes gene_type:complete